MRFFYCILSNFYPLIRFNDNQVANLIIVKYVLAKNINIFVAGYRNRYFITQTLDHAQFNLCFPLRRLLGGLMSVQHDKNIPTLFLVCFRINHFAAIVIKSNGNVTNKDTPTNTFSQKQHLPHYTLNTTTNATFTNMYLPTPTNDVIQHL